jgi:phage terminase large subunit-like protein
MADHFLHEIRHLHQLRKDIRSLPLAKAEEFMKSLGDDAADDWVFRARDAQLPPTDQSWCWLFLGGRGAGKSHSSRRQCT